MERDYLAEAFRIDAAEGSPGEMRIPFLPERAHIRALCWELRRKEQQAEFLRLALEEAQHQLEILRSEVLSAVEPE